MINDKNTTSVKGDPEKRRIISIPAAIAGYSFNMPACNATFTKGYRQTFVGAICCLLAACGSGDNLKEGQIGYVKGYFGGAAADEPRSVLVARNILTAGGNAVDAAVGLYFSLSVTLPSAASLGGGGVCVVYDHKAKKVEMLDFLPRSPKTMVPGADRPAALPGNPRGFFALHAKYGKMRWEGLVSPAENLARFGNQVSRAFANDTQKVASALLRDAGNKEVFGGSGGMSVTERDFVEQLDLAASLSTIRAKGPGAFYSGPFAQNFVMAANRAGGGLNLEELRSYAPKWHEPVKVKIGHDTAYFAGPPAIGGLTGAEFLNLLTYDDRYASTDPQNKEHMFVDAAMRTYADRSSWLSPSESVAKKTADLLSETSVEKLLKTYQGSRRTAVQAVNPAIGPRQETPAATTFVTVDNTGSAVSCALTMNNLFGTGRMAKSTGILLAAKPGRNGRGPIALGPVIVINDHVNELRFVGGASGGVTAPVALINVMAETMIMNKPLAEAVTGGRIHHGGYPDKVYYEPSISATVVEGLRNKGHDVVASGSLGRVNAFYCTKSLPPYPETCSISADPRGFGLASHASN